MYSKPILRRLSLLLLSCCCLSGVAEGRAVPGPADPAEEITDVAEMLLDEPMQLHPEDSITVHYPSGYRYVIPSYNGNAAALDSVITKVRSYMDENRDFEVVIRSYSSPDGDLRSNNRLTRLRGDSLASYIIRYTGIDPGKVTCEPEGIGYDILRTLVEKDTQVPDREQVLDALRTVPETVEYAPGMVKEQLKVRLLTIAGGRAYVYMKQHMFPKLRNSMSVLLIVRRRDAGEPLRQYIPESVQNAEVYALSTREGDPILAAQRPAVVAGDRGAASVVPADSAVAVAPEADSAVAVVPAVDSGKTVSGRKKSSFTWESSRWWLKTNLPFYALVVPNLAVEVRLADQWSLDIPVYYSPYTVARNYRYRVFALQPSARYWLKPGMKGHFFGVHLLGGMFNISVDERNRYQDTDGMWGAGLDYGYALKFSKHWGMEFNIGVGYIWTRYDTFYNVENGISWDTSTANYLGITRLGISLIYKL